MMQAADAAGIASADVLFVSVELSHRVLSDTEASALTRGAVIEDALQQELAVLRTGPSAASDQMVLSWLTDNAIRRVLLRSGTGDTFDTEIAAGHAEILRAFGDAHASLAFSAFVGQPTGPVSLASVPLGAEIVSEPPDRELARRIESVGIRHSTWAMGPEGPSLIDADGPATTAPGEDAEVDGDLVSFARLYNRLMLPGHHLQWLDVLLGRELETVYLAEGSARYPDLAEDALVRARAATEQLLQSSVTPAGDEGAVASGVIPGVRQVIGRPGNGGRASAPVTRVCSGAEGAVYVCDQLSQSELPAANSCVAIVESGGYGFDLAALVARKRGIPHVYQATESDLIHSGATAEVAGSLGIVTITSQS